MRLPLMERMLSDHWEGWVDDKIPALGGLTPREAVKTSDGRESVEALLQSAEEDGPSDEFSREVTLKAVGRVRQRLGLSNGVDDG